MLLVSSFLKSAKQIDLLTDLPFLHALLHLFFNVLDSLHLKPISTVLKARHVAIEYHEEEDKKKISNVEHCKPLGINTFGIACDPKVPFVLFIVLVRPKK